MISIATDSTNPSRFIDHLAADVMAVSSVLDDESILDLNDGLNDAQRMVDTKWESIHHLTRGDLESLDTTRCITEYVDICALIALCNAYGGPSTAMKSAYAARLDAVMSRFDGDGEINDILDTIESLVAVRWRLANSQEFAACLDKAIIDRVKMMARMIEEQ